MKWLTIIFVGLFVFPFCVYAEKEFNIGLDVTYRFDKDGVSTVEQIVTLTNLTQFMYANNYEMTLVGDTPKNIKAWDDGGQMKIDEEDGSTGRKIRVNFNSPVAGRDKKYQFRFSYIGKPAVHNGQVWEVSFPRLANADDIDSYRLSVIIPKVFGKLAFSSPNPESNNGEVMVFSHTQGAQYGVVSAFGDFQTYEFDLTFNLDHAQAIAIPADTSYQRVFYDQIDPFPENITSDLDGNWLASYSLKDKEPKIVNVRGHANVLSESSQFIPGIDYHNLTFYTKPTKLWPSTNQKFIDLAKIYKTPQEIYNFVVKSLKYDPNKKPNRLGAIDALENPQSALCTEFTDLFVTMSRASGIPAREINGFAYTQDQSLRPLSLGGNNTLHAWPQYWDFAKSTWISVDPTWESTTHGIDYFTKLDFNHLAFVAHGLTDDTPSATNRVVKVKFGEFKDYSTRPLELSVGMPWQVIAPLGASVSLQITNPNPFAIYRTALLISGSNIKLLNLDSNSVDIIPPFAKYNIQVDILPTWQLDFKQKNILFEAGNQKLTYNVSNIYFLIWHASIAIFSSVVLISLVLVTSRIWSLYLQRHKL